MYFPKIDYPFWLNVWNQSVGLKSTYSNMHSRIFLHFQGDIMTCENEINRLIDAVGLDYSSAENRKTVETVIDLIYAWGGPSGRMFYFDRKGKSSPRIQIMETANFKRYFKGIELAMQSNPLAVETFQSIPGIGSSFASKHAFFWSKSAPKRLIIIDSKIAGALGYVNLQDLFVHHEYTKVLIEFSHKSEDYFGTNDASNIERALFAFHNNYFLNNNKSMRLNPKISKDFEEAFKLFDLMRISNH